MHSNFSGGGGGGGMPGGGCSKAKEDSSSHGKEESKAEPMIPLSCLEALKGELNSVLWNLPLLPAHTSEIRWIKKIGLW